MKSNHLPSTPHNHDDEDEPAAGGKNGFLLSSMKCENHPMEYKEEYQQLSIDGRAVRGLDELYQAAEIAEPVFRNAIERKVRKVLDDCGFQNEDNKYISIAPLKKKRRAVEKAHNAYSPRNPGPRVSWLTTL